MIIILTNNKIKSGLKKRSESYSSLRSPDPHLRYILGIFIFKNLTPPHPGSPLHGGRNYFRCFWGKWKIGHWQIFLETDIYRSLIFFVWGWDKIYNIFLTGGGDVFQENMYPALEYIINKCNKKSSLIYRRQNTSVEILLKEIEVKMSDVENENPLLLSFNTRVIHYVFIFRINKCSSIHIIFVKSHLSLPLCKL